MSEVSTSPNGPQTLHGWLRHSSRSPQEQFDTHFELTKLHAYGERKNHWPGAGKSTEEHAEDGLDQNEWDAFRDMCAIMHMCAGTEYNVDLNWEHITTGLQWLAKHRVDITKLKDFTVAIQAKNKLLNNSNWETQNINIIAKQIYEYPH